MLTTGLGVAAGFGASTVTEGSVAVELAPVCDVAGPHSKTVDKKAKAEGATNFDDSLMTCPFKEGLSVPMRTRDRPPDANRTFQTWLPRVEKISADHRHARGGHTARQNRGCEYPA